METIRKKGLRAEVSDLLEKSYQLRVSNIPQSVDMARRALILCENQADLADLHAKALSLLSLFSMIKGEYNESIAFAEQAIAEYGAIGDDHGVADAMYNVAGVYYKTNNFHSGLIYLVDCLGIYKKYDDYHNQARVLKSLGTIYEYFGDTKRAVQSYEESVKCGLEIGDKNLQSNAFNPLSGIYLDRDEVDKAMTTILLAIKMKEETGDLRGMAFSIYGRGKVFAKMGRYEEAETDYLHALKIHSDMGEKLGWGMTMNKLGCLYMDTGQFERSRETFNEALEFTRKNKISFLNFKAYHRLYELSRKEGNSDDALRYLEAYIQEKDFVINAQTLHVIEAYQMLTDKQALELEANVQKERVQIIEQKNQELDAFFLKVSHDLKGPISSIIGLNEIVKEKISDPEALRYFDIYKRKIFHINNILDELVRITKIDLAEECRELVDFGHIVNECFESLVYLENHSKIKFIAEISPDLVYRAELALMNTIIQNLIENGIKYGDPAKEDPYVRISVAKEDSQIVIRAWDNGIGMDEEVKEKAFNMFFKANKSALGSGLGLYLLHRAVEKLEGRIQLQSTLGEGTQIQVTLPFR